MSPPRWRSTLASTFTRAGFRRTLIAFPSSYVFCTCLDQAGARFELRLARGFLCLLRLNLAWRPSSLESVGPVQTRRAARFGFGSGSRPLVLLWLDASNPEQMDLSRPGGCRCGLDLARGFLCFIILSLAWRPSSLEPVQPVHTTRVQGSGLGLGLARGL